VFLLYNQISFLTKNSPAARLAVSDEKNSIIPDKNIPKDAIL